MTDQNVATDQWADRTLTDAQQKNRDAAALIPVTRSGVIPMNFAQMVDYAKYMSTAKYAVGAHLMGNVGACLAVMEIANQFGLPAYAVARQSYMVNNRLCFMGQFFHTIIEDFAPLKKGANGRKLQWRFEGEGPTLKIFVSATYDGATEPVEYESPIFRDITIKNSPLWKSPSPSEVKRQFVYFSVRGWQTMYWPEGMMHAITEDEAAALPPSEYARDITPVSASLVERLAASRATEGGTRQGFRGEVEDAHFTETGGETVNPATGEVTNSQATTGGANEVANNEKDQTRLADASGTENRSAAAQESGRAGEKPATESQANAENTSATTEGPGQGADESASRLPDGRTSGAAALEPGKSGAASNAGAQGGDSSERVTSGGGENRLLQSDLLSGQYAPGPGSEGEPEEPHRQTDGADGSCGTAPPAPDRLRSYSRALLSITDAPVKLGKQGDAWERKHGKFEGAEEEKRKAIYAVHLNRLTGSIDIEACKKQVEGTIGK